MNKATSGNITSASSLGKKLRRLREEREEGLREVADAVGVSHTQLAWIERNMPNARLSLESFVRLLAYYNLAIRAQEHDDEA